MKRLAVAALTASLSLIAAASAPAAPPSFTSLNPGGDANLTEQVPVNVVFVGYEPAYVPAGTFLAQLPTTYDPVVRSRGFYGNKELTGIHYTYDYSTTYTDTAWENSFFSYLTSIAKPESTVDGRTRTLFQDQYNAQQKNALDVGTNYFIDAPSVEKWLIANAPAGVDTHEDTVFFINWYGRSDFKFHTYTKFGEPDPDTGYDFGKNRQSRKLIAWGGTTPDDPQTGLGALGINRVWFHDLSAGPDSWTNNWDVDDSDVDGDGVADYVIPPVWEYGSYRPKTKLVDDLARVARFGAINLLFTSSPLYPPYVNADLIPDTINLDIQTLEGWNKVDAASSLVDTALLKKNISDVHRVNYTVDVQRVPFKGDVQNCYLQWIQNVRCYNDRTNYPAFADLFLNAALNIGSYRADGGGDYQAEFLAYAVDQSPKSAPFLGFADDNWIDGTPSGTFNFVSPDIVTFGYGLTTTMIHEYGHHFGMSHPHDGYDSELGVDYEPTGPYLSAAWATDEVNSMMSYIDLNWDYSQFDRDNANRFQAAGYYKIANRIAKDVLASPNAGLASGDLATADSELSLARMAMAVHDYNGTFDHARLAYKAVRAGAAKAGVAVGVREPSAWALLAPQKGSVGLDKRAYAYVDRYDGRRAAP